jgi:methylmalonyl-CoA mutase C-terminal domain/subunit
MNQIGVIVGGIIPPQEQQKLKDLGVAECFGPGASIKSIIEFLSGRSQSPVS